MMNFLMLWLVGAFLLFVMFFRRKKAGGGFTGFVFAVFVHFGLGGFGGAA
jgi:hypothetical protein